jgi:hypothetical protein
MIVIILNDFPNAEGKQPLSFLKKENNSIQAVFRIIFIIIKALK